MDHFLYQLTLLFYHPQELFAEVVAERKKWPAFLIFSSIALILTIKGRVNLWRQDVSYLHLEFLYFLRDFIFIFLFIFGLYLVFTAVWALLGYLFTGHNRFTDMFMCWVYTYPLTLFWILGIDFLWLQGMQVQGVMIKNVITGITLMITIIFLYGKIKSYLGVLREIWHLSGWQIALGSFIVIPLAFLCYLFLWLSGLMRIWIF